MKKIALIAIAVATLLSSCSKNDPLPQLPPGYKLKVVAGDFFREWQQNNATLSKDTIQFIGNWNATVNFESKDTSSSNIYFYQNDENDDPIGTVTFSCKFSGATLKDGVYSGTGAWYISKSEGTLASFKTGAGKLQYKEQPQDEPDFNNAQYFVTLEGVGK